MTVKKTVRAVNIPGVHPGLLERIREAERAELEGELPRQVDGPQKITRPTIDAFSRDRLEQVRVIGLVESAAALNVDAREALSRVPGFLPGVDLDEVWDQLSESQKIRAGSVERFRLEMDTTLERVLGGWQPPHKIGGRLDARNLERSTKNLLGLSEAASDVLADDTRACLQSFVSTTAELLRQGLRQNAVAGIDAPTLFPILRDWVEKLVYQEIQSREAAMGDRGIRAIWGSIHLADQIYTKLKRLRAYTPRWPLLARLIHVHADIGHTAYAARVSYRGTRMQRAYGARIFTDEVNRYRALFTPKELELARLAVATHNDAELPLVDAPVLALARAVDHLVPFGAFRVSRHLREMGGAHPYLDRMLEQLAAGDTDGIVGTRGELARFLLEAKVPEPLVLDIVGAFRPFERLADPAELGPFAGVVQSVDVDVERPPGHVTVTLGADPFAERYQVLFDYQQDQLLRVLRATGVSPGALRSDAEVVVQVEGQGKLVIRRG